MRVTERVPAQEQLKTLTGIIQITVPDYQRIGTLGEEGRGGEGRGGEGRGGEGREGGRGGRGGRGGEGRECECRTQGETRGKMRLKVTRMQREGE